MKSMLIFPPGWDPRGPYLSLPVLKSYLKNNGRDILIRDENVNYYDEFFSNSFFTRIVRENAFLKCNIYFGATHHIQEAKDIIRSKSSKRKERKFAWTVLSNLNYLASKVYNGFTLDFNSMNFKYSYNSTAEIMQAISDTKANPLIDYFERYCETITEINNLGIEYIGFSVTGSTQLIPTLTMCKAIRENCPTVRHIQLGGNYITRIAPNIGEKHCFWKYIDSILLYDGEENLCSFLNKLEREESFSEVHNLCYLDDNKKLVRNKIVESHIINDLTPDFDGFNFSKYFTENIWLPIYTSRACINKCTFCTIPNASGGKFRHMPAQKTVKNMEILKKKYNISHFSFVDETFLVSKMKQIAQLIIDNEDKDMSWYCETRFSRLLTADTTKLLRKGGCSSIQFGLESYNQRVLNLMNKNIDIAWIEPNIINCFEAGISVHLFFMTGFPTETLEEAKKTYEFSNRMIMKSKIDYKLPYSTRGFGTFGLEVGAGVYEQPKTFDIDILNPNLDDDLRISREYISHRGLSPDEAEYLVNTMRSSKVTLQSVLGKKEFGIDIPDPILPSEIELINEREKKEKKHHYKVYGHYTGSRRLSLNSYSTFITNEENQMIIFYNIKNDVFLSYEKSEISLDGKNVISYMKKVIDELIYYDFFEISDIVHSSVDEILSGKYKLNLNDYFIETYNQTDVLLYNKVFKEAMITNVLGHELLKYFTESHTVTEWGVEIINSGIDLPFEKLNELIVDALESNILKVVV
ncbi:magnesium-protoporphyrin IX monomethyl ester cyclase [Bacilli bacterium]|nr:magnesium-protoporphyrin IX monomethyl ester cyclase [Bacilli bacterium]